MGTRSLPKQMTSALNSFLEVARKLGIPRLMPVAAIVFSLSSPGSLRAADDARTNAAQPRVEEAVSSPDMLRVYLQLQEQIHEAQLAIDRQRQESEAAASRNAESMSTIQNLQEALSHRTTDLESSNHLVLILVIVLAGVGLVGLGFMGYMQLRAVNRLAEMTSALPAANPSLPALRSYGGFGEVEGQMFSSAELSRSTTGFLMAMQRLEKRIAELERAGHHPLNDRAAHESPAATAAPPAAEDASGKIVNVGEQINDLMAKGQRLLEQEQAAEAAAAFDEVLALDVNHAEALVKKGVALEQLRRPAEAIECYDRAIAADSSLTIAFLHKGGLCNRLERFHEAMECYEQALRTQEKRRAA